MSFKMMTMRHACREAFPDTLRILNNVVKNMHSGGAPSEWDLNNVLLRFAMDMTSIVVSASIPAKQTGQTSHAGPCSCALPTCIRSLCCFVTRTLQKGLQR